MPYAEGNGFPSAAGCFGLALVDLAPPVITHLLGVLPNHAGYVPFLLFSVLETPLWIFFFPPPMDKMFLMIWHSLTGRAACQIKRRVLFLARHPRYLSFSPSPMASYRGPLGLLCSSELPQPRA